MILRMTEERAAMEAKRIRGAELLRSGVKQKDIARELGVSVAAVSRWSYLIAGGQSLTARRTPGRPRKPSAQQIALLTPVQVLSDDLAAIGVAYV